MELEELIEYWKVKPPLVTLVAALVQGLGGEAKELPSESNSYTTAEQLIAQIGLGHG